MFSTFIHVVVNPHRTDVKACRDAGVPESIIASTPNDIWIEFLFAPAYLDIIRGRTSGKIVALIEANAHIFIPELAEAIGVIERSIERGKKLQENRIRHAGPAKGGHWQVISSGL